MKAYLILEDGSVFEGISIGSNKEVVTEIVFNTSMTGYLELITDSSYAKQGIVMTYPLIGNYGVNEDDVKDLTPWIDCLIVHELASYASNFRNQISLEEYLVKHDIPGIQGIDTRALTKLLREKGTMHGVLTTNSEFNIDIEIERAIAYKTTELIKMVSTKEITTLDHEGNYSMALFDYGSKHSLINEMVSRGCKVTIYPHNTAADLVLASKPDGIILSDGPGNPEDCVEIIEQVKALYESNIPILAVSLGHQLLALATGAKVEKLKYGHRGCNQPVKDLRTGKSYITNQGHGYVVKKDSINTQVAEVSFTNCNDGTVEGLTYHKKQIISVQFHPELGPYDTAFLLDQYMDMIGGQNNA